MSWNGINQPPHSVPFWDFIHSLDPNHPQYAGIGVDHTQPPPPPGVGPRPWGGAGYWGGPWSRRMDAWGTPRGRGCRGRHCRGYTMPPPGEEEPPTGPEAAAAAAAAAGAAAGGEKARDPEKQDSPDTMRATPPDADDPPEVPPEDDSPHRHHCGRGRGGHGFWGRGGLRHGPQGPHGPHGPHGPPPPPPYPGATPFDFRGMMAAFANHPFAQQLRAYAEQARAMAAAHGYATGGAGAADDNGEAFVPPVDIFNTPDGWTIHVALPGAKKEDVGVHWDAGQSQLAVSGVVHRPGDEQFLQGLVSGERRIGLFQRTVRLPPEPDAGAGPDAAQREMAEVDEEGITARMEDGVLVIVVPKLEREWTEVRKVDIE